MANEFLTGSQRTSYMACTSGEACYCEAVYDNFKILQPVQVGHFYITLWRGFFPFCKSSRKLFLTEEVKILLVAD